MTLSALRPWLGPAAAVVATLALVRECNGKNRAEATLRQEHEAAQLAAKGLEVVRREAGSLKSELADAMLRNADLRAVLELTRKAAPGAQPISATHASTGSVTVHRSNPATAAPIGGATPPPVSAPAGHSGEGVPCLLSEGDTAEIRVDTVELQAKEGTHVLVGAASAWKGDQRLFGGPFREALTDAVEKAPPAAQGARWGAGPLVGLGTHGALAGGILATPEARLPLLGWRVSATVVAAAGTSEAVVLGGVTVRP